MKVKGSLVDILVEINPRTYGPYLSKENGVSVLYLEILKASFVWNYGFSSVVLQEIEKGFVTVRFQG